MCTYTPTASPSASPSALTLELLQRQVRHLDLPWLCAQVTGWPQVPLQPVGPAGPEDGGHGQVVRGVHQHHHTALATAAGQHSTARQVSVSTKNKWECLLHVSTFATTRVALPTGVKPG
jgi:hypothetical protein